MRNDTTAMTRDNAVRYNGGEFLHTENQRIVPIIPVESLVAHSV